MTHRGKKRPAKLDAASQVAAERALLASVFSVCAAQFWPILESTRSEDYGDSSCRALRTAFDSLEHSPTGIGSVASVAAASGGVLTAQWLAALIDEGCATTREAELCRDAILRASAVRGLDRASRAEDRIEATRAAIVAADQRAAACAPEQWPALMTGRELFDLQLPDRHALLGRWLFPGDRMLIHGPRGRGKSHIAMSIALAISAGPTGPGLLGWRAPEALPVLYLDFELGPRRLQRILCSSVYATHPPTAPDSLTIYPSHQRVCDEEGLKALTALIDHVGARVVVVDSQTFAFAVESENDASMWAPYADWINALSAREITYIGLGHDGRVEGHVRGTSAREDSLDLIMALEPKGTGAAGIDVVLKWTKTRGLAPGDVDRLHVVLGREDGPGNSSPVWQWEVDEDETGEHNKALDDRADEIRRLSAQGLQQIEIAERLGITKWAVSRALRRGAER